MINLCSSCIPKKRKYNIGSPETSSSNPSIHKQRVSSPDSPHIIIIGAGAAGLACAVKLLDHGINNIKILEAENRIGGRILTVPFADNFVDLGAQFVHGERKNVVYEMVKDLNLLESSGDVYFSFECVRSNGEIVPTDHVEKLKNILSDVLLNQSDTMADFRGSFGEFLERRFFEALNKPQYENINKKIAREFYENFQKMESSESSVGLSEVSAQGFKEYWDCDGDYLLNWKENGYKEFLRILTRAEPDGDTLGILNKKVVFGAKVETIMWDQEDGRITVQCEKPEMRYIADNVVTTVSLGVLKEYAKEMFDPPLPSYKIVAIDGLGYGDVFKVFIEFPYAFWPPTWSGFATLWREEDINELRMNNMLWIAELYGFYPVNKQPHVLVAWAVGPTVQYMERLPRKEFQKHIWNLLERFITQWVVPEPKSIMTTTWSVSKNFRGAYSFRTLKTESLATSASALAKPVNTLLTVALEDPDEQSEEVKSTRVTIKPTLLFAGEATSSHYFSTVHGAVESGWREANRLAGYYANEE